MTTTSIRSNAATVLLLCAAVFFAAVAIRSFATIGVAHGDTGAAPAVVEHVLVQQPIESPPSVLALIAVMLGGLGVILGGLSTVLHAIAPRTKTTIDDTLAADVDAAHAKLDELLRLFGAQAPRSTTVNVTAPPEKPGPGVGPAAAMLAVLLLGLSTVALPACGASQRETTIKAALVTVDTARDSFVAYDAAEQANIVNKATSLDDGKTKLAAYRNDRVKTVEAFTVAYRAIAAAATLNNDPSVTGLKAAVAQLLAAVATITGGTP